jgi:hypothetical protein
VLEFEPETVRIIHVGRPIGVLDREIRHERPVVIRTGFLGLFIDGDSYKLERALAYKSFVRLGENEEKISRF